MRIDDLSMPLGSSAADVKRAAARKARLSEKDVRTFLILRKSIDARKKGAIRECYGVLISDAVERLPEVTFPHVGERDHRPVVIGFGPAGIFAAYVLALAGMRPLVLERGLPIEERAPKVDALWQRGVLDPNANAEYGEGGAGAFSDGKLNSGIKDKELSRFVLETFVKFGAPKEILYLNKPHVGTDKLRETIRAIRGEIERLGGEVRFRAEVTDLVREGGTIRLTADGEYLTDRVVLAIGHSARDTYERLLERGFAMESKPFAVGVRLESLQEDINEAMYGVRRDPRLPAADYKVAEHTALGGVYSFCMCPGGYVVCASSEEGGVVTNGMSYHARDGRNANAALLVGVDENDYGGGVLAGVEYQRRIERKAFGLAGGGYRAPCQRVGDFLKGRIGTLDGVVEPSYLPGVAPADLSRLLPERITGALRLALPALDRRVKGLAREDNLLTAPETRSSSPVRVLRDESYRSPSDPAFYPCGEGCGYAGGIMSAAVDGIRVARAILDECLR
ncbi:MAG: hypothetical protein IJT69_01805 [Clostridia bacterium]|nr:hypothetical protein [Clostridia bacterium]